MFRKTLFKNDRYRVTKAWGRQGAIKVYISPMRNGFNPTGEEAAALLKCLADLNAKGVKITADNSEMERLVLAMAYAVEKRVMRELGDRLWNS